MGSKLNHVRSQSRPAARSNGPRDVRSGYVRAWTHAQSRLPLMRHNAVHDPADMFAFIVRFKSEHDGNSPTTTDLMQALAITSKSVARYTLRRLQDVGLIRIDRDQVDRDNIRSIQVQGGRWDWQAPERKGDPA